MTNSQNSQIPQSQVSSLDQAAADMLQFREDLLQEIPDTAEYDKAKFKYNLSGERFVENCRRTTEYEHKFKPHYNLSSGQIAEAKSEYKSAMGERIIRVATTHTSVNGANLKHYINAVSGFASIDACREIAKGKVIKGNLCFPEMSLNASMSINTEDSEDVLDSFVDSKRNDDLFLDEIRDISREITLRDRPDVNLWDVLELILQDYTMKEIGLKLNANPDTLFSFIKSNRVKDYMKSFLKLSLLVFLFIATEYC
jgi:hypothetical protein